MNKVNFKADIIQEIGPKFVLEPFKTSKFQVQQAGRTMGFENHCKKNPRISFYAQKFRKAQSRPSSSIPQTVRQATKTFGIRNQQPKNMGVMGSFFVNTRPNTRRISNSLANYHAQLMKRANSQSNSGLHRVSLKQSSQKQINKKNNADVLYQNALNDMNEYFSLVKLSAYKRNEKKIKTNNNPKLSVNSNRNCNSESKNSSNKHNLTICTNFVFCANTNNSGLSVHSEKRYVNTEIRSRQIQRQQDNSNLNIRALKPTAFRYSQNGRNQIQSSNKNAVRKLQNNEKPEIIIKLITQQMLPSNNEMANNIINQYQSTLEKQSPKKIHIQRVFSSSPKRQQKAAPKKKNTYIMEYFGKIKENSTYDEAFRLKAMYYRDIIWKIWFNSDWKVKVESYTSNSRVEPPKYFVGKGNNSKLVKAIMNRRPWWKLQTKQQNANFLWTQLKIYSAYQIQKQYQKVTCFQVDDQIKQEPQSTNQDKQTSRNSIPEFNSNLQNEQLFQLQPIQVLNQQLVIEQEDELTKGYKKFVDSQIKIQHYSPQKNQNCEQTNNFAINKVKVKCNQSRIYDQQWLNKKLKLNDRNCFLMTQKKYNKWQRYIKNINNYKKQAKNSQNLEHRKNLQKDLIVMEKYPEKTTNHLEYSRLIGNKKALYKTMSIYYELLKKSSKFLPMTYHITSGLEDNQYLKFLSQYFRRVKEENNSMWIIKPGQMSNRGSGIKVCKDIQQIKKILKNKKCHTNGKPFSYIIQQYIRQPFLYQGRKFDIRHYIMINSTYGRIKGYFYEEGYIRTTSYKYSTTNQDSSIHLTNDAVQKYCKQYGKYEKGNKLSYEDFQKYLKSLPDCKQKQYSFYDKILPKIRQISIDVINASYYTIDSKRKGNNFQIFGLDIMIDSDFRPWLIEVNTNPCLQLSSPVLAKVIPRMLDNAFTISLDPLFPPPNDLAIGNKKNNLPENYIIDNKFELVFDQIVEGKKLNRLYGQIKDQLCQMEGFGSDQEAYQSAQDDYNAQY